MKLQKTIGVAAAVCAAAITTQAQLVDDFSGNFGAYTQTRVLDNGVAEANVSFSNSGGALSAAYGGTVNQAEQVLFLRNDYSLGVGKMLFVDVAFPTQTSQMDLGIAVCGATGPTAASAADTDTRDTANWAAIYVRPSQDAVRNTSSIGGVVTTGTGIAGAVETSVSGLYIARTSLTDFTLGYLDSANGFHDTRTISFAATDVGTMIGFYGDLRAVGGTLGTLDNLRISAVPEPSTLALGGLGIALFIARRKKS